MVFLHRSLSSMGGLLTDAITRRLSFHVRVYVLELTHPGFELVVLLFSFVSLSLVGEAVIQYHIPGLFAFEQGSMFPLQAMQR